MGVSTPCLDVGGVFSFPCFRRGLPGDTADLWIMLSSTLPDELAKYESSIVKALLFPGDNGVPACRPDFDGLPGASFMAFSKAIGRSFAPGGFCFLLGLPWGVDTGVMKLLRFGVFGLSPKVSF